MRGVKDWVMASKVENVMVRLSGRPARLIRKLAAVERRNINATGALALESLLSRRGMDEDQLDRLLDAMDIDPATCLPNGMGGRKSRKRKGSE
jgi:hypothetical protein